MAKVDTFIVGRYVLECTADALLASVLVAVRDELHDLLEALVHTPAMRRTVCGDFHAAVANVMDGMNGVDQSRRLSMLQVMAMVQAVRQTDHRTAVLGVLVDAAKKKLAQRKEIEDLRKEMEDLRKKIEERRKKIENRLNDSFNQFGNLAFVTAAESKDFRTRQADLGDLAQTTPRKTRKTAPDAGPGAPLAPLAKKARSNRTASVNGAVDLPMRKQLD